MKKKICILLAFITVFSLTGCAKAVQLTSEEQALIAEYSSYILVKHSKQNDSLLLSRDKLDKAVAFKEEQDRRAAERRANTKTESSSAAASSGNSGSSGTTVSAQTEPVTSSISMTDAVGVGGLEFTFKGYDVTDYIQGSAFSVNASPGKKLVVLNFNVTNTSDKELTCDLKTAKTRFKGSFNGSTISPLGTAFLPNDIASFDKNTKFKAKEKSDCVLVFDVPKDLAESLTDVKLSVTKDGASGASSISL